MMSFTLSMLPLIPSLNGLLLKYLHSVIFITSSLFLDHKNLSKRPTTYNFFYIEIFYVHIFRF